MFDFYNLCYSEGYLKLEDLHEACKWNVITKEEYRTITGENYITQ